MRFKPWNSYYVKINIKITTRCKSIFSDNHKSMYVYMYMVLFITLKSCTFNEESPFYGFKNNMPAPETPHTEYKSINHTLQH